METHDNDPTTHEPPDPWSAFQEEFGGLGERLKETYRKVTSEGGPSEEEMRDAFGTLLGAWARVAESISSALQDPEVRQKLETAASSFVDAVGNTISELGQDLRKPDRWTPTTPNGERVVIEEDKR